MRGGLRTLSRRGSGVRIPPTVETTDPPHQGGVVQVGERPLPRTNPNLAATILEHALWMSRQGALVAGVATGNVNSPMIQSEVAWGLSVMTGGTFAGSASGDVIFWT